MQIATFAEKKCISLKHILALPTRGLTSIISVKAVWIWKYWSGTPCIYKKKGYNFWFKQVCKINSVIREQFFSAAAQGSKSWGSRGSKMPPKLEFSGFIAFLCDNFWKLGEQLLPLLPWLRGHCLGTYYLLRYIST